MSREIMQQAFENMQKNERHTSYGETQYWCNQYKMFAVRLLTELAKPEQPQTDLRKAALTQDRLKELYFYDSETGIFTRKFRLGGHVANKVAGYKNPNGYIYIQIDGKNYRAHRLAWLYVYGEFPVNHIDHINNVKSDNRIKNLRDVTHNVNIQNTKKPITNTSGVKGVSWLPSRNKWLASIKHFGKSIHLGHYETIEDATQARIDGEVKLWGTP